MLVLSRRADQQVVFPHLGITLSVLQVRGRIVKLGIDAPEMIKVFRQEALQSPSSERRQVAGEALASDADPTSSHEPLDREAEHRRRNELNLLQLKLEMIQRRIERGEELEAESTLRDLLSSASMIDHKLAGSNADDGPSSIRPTRLLVVEDCDNERQLMAYVLASHGFDVHVARDGIEAMEQLHMWGAMPDFVLMDMQMPMSDGLETLYQIRHNPKLADLKVFAVTGTQRDLDNEPSGRGWDGWFSKPLDVGALIRRLREEQAATVSTTCP